MDRLSKLERSVNEMIKEKKIKEELRGYVGAPLQFHKIKENIEGEDIPLYLVPPSSDRKNRKTPERPPY